MFNINLIVLWAISLFWTIVHSTAMAAVIYVGWKITSPIYFSQVPEVWLNISFMHLWLMVIVTRVIISLITNK